MYIVDAIITLFKLKWTQQEPMVRPLPPHVKRTYVKTPEGDLELLICEAKPTSSTIRRQPPIFFAHGGYGSAGCYLEWMDYLHENDYSGTLYSYSARNHGASYSLPFWRMAFKTSFEHIQADMVACLNHTIELELQQNSLTRPPILVGHSSGGGLSQYLLSGSSSNPANKVKASGLCLVDSIPHYGSYDIYYNWWKHDPWFTLRQILHLQHPTSPLSTHELVHGAFFGHKFPKSQTQEFDQWMPAYESYGWPFAMFGNSLWQSLRGRSTWLSAKDIVSNIEGAGNGKDNVCVMVGKEDMMYRPFMWERQVQEYGDALKTFRKEGAAEVNTDLGKTIEAVTAESKDGVRLVLVKDSGHHVQNDVYHDKAAEALLRWANHI